MDSTKSQTIETIEEGHSETASLLKELNYEEYDLILPYSLKSIKYEIIYLITSAIPIILSTFTQFSIPMINIYAMGQFGSVEISAVALGAVFANSTGNSILIGMSSALDTLCSQAFTGADDKKKVGSYLQKGIIIQLIMCIPICLLWCHAEPVLLFLKQDPRVAALTAQYLKVLSFGLPPFMIFECLKKYLQAQRIMKAQTVVLIITVPIVAFLNYLLMWNKATSIGFIGAAFTLVCANWLMFLLMLAYIYLVEGLECWGGWCRSSLYNWSEYIKLGCSGIIMLCSEWWAWNVISLSVTFLGTDTYAAHFIAINIDTVFYSTILSISIVASNRIGNLLGAQQMNRAKLATFISVGFAILIPIINSLFLATFKTQIASLFTKDKNLYDILLKLIPFICIYHVFDSISCCSNGILRGQGKQRIGAIVNLVSWYMIAIPVSLFITFSLNFGIQGMWFGICLALFGTGITLSYLVIRSDWKQLILEAKTRLDEYN